MLANLTYEDKTFFVLKDINSEAPIHLLLGGWEKDTSIKTKTEINLKDMPIEIKKKTKESSQSLIRRFTQRVQRSGLLIRARKNRFKIRQKSKQMNKRSALRREELRVQYQKSKKMGK